MPDERYSGYTNRETFEVAILVENEQLIYHKCKTLTGREIEASFKRIYDDVLEELDGRNRRNTTWTRRLLIIGSLDRVNWSEIAQSLQAA